MSRFTEWYARTGKDKLSKARKARYNADPQYREGAKAASRAYKTGRRDAQPVEYTVEFGEAAERLEISTATLRAWRRRGFYPAPYMYQGRRWFTEGQMQQLQSIANHLRENRTCLNEDKVRFELEIKVQLLHLNWG